MGNAKFILTTRRSAPRRASQQTRKRIAALAHFVPPPYSCRGITCLRSLPSFSYRELRTDTHVRAPSSPATFAYCGSSASVNKVTGTEPATSSARSVRKVCESKDEGRRARREKQDTARRNASRANATIKGTGRAARRSWLGDSRVIFVLYGAYGIKWQKDVLQIRACPRP